MVLCSEVWWRYDVFGGRRVLTLDLDVLLSPWIFGIVRLNGIMQVIVDVIKALESFDLSYLHFDRCVLTLGLKLLLGANHPLDDLCSRAA